MSSSRHLASVFQLALVIYIKIATAGGENILMLFHEPGSSHGHIASVVGRILENRGHNVTFLFPVNHQKQVHDTWGGGQFDILKLRNDCSSESERIDVVNLAQELRVKSGTFDKELIKMGMRFIEGVIQAFTLDAERYMCDADVTDLLLSSKFDLIMLDGSFLWLHGIVNKLAIPYVGMASCATSSLTNSWNHAPNLPAILPSFLIRKHHRKPMSFLWRVYNVINIYGAEVFFKLVSDRLMLAANHDYASEATLIPPTKSFGMSSIWLANADYSTDVPRPFMPNTALVGGLTIEEPGVLDHEYQEIADNAVHGIIVVSMGTNVVGLGQEKNDIMAAVLARFPQTVVWKEPVPKPCFVGNNTILRKWIPQKELLAHPSTLAMVYHCGNNGAFEALYHGIPIIGIPVFGDQPDVAYRIMSNGMGVVVEVPEMTDETLFDAVSEVIDNRKYRDRAAYLSSVYRDNPAPPRERAVYWAEYALRHKGNTLMRARIANMDIVQEYLLDVWAFLGFVFIAAILITRKMLIVLLNISGSRSYLHI